MVAEKLSSYRFFNFIIPGAVFLGFLKYHSVSIKVDTNIWWFLLASYFCGILISRVGSILIEEPLKFINIIQGYDVKTYIRKQKEDSLVGIMLELANTYRTVCALFSLLLAYTIFTFPWNCSTIKIVLVELFFIVLFLLSFCKQYRYFIKSLS